MATAQLSMIEELSGKIMQCVGLIMDSAIPEPIKEILQNKVVSGTMNIATGVGQILAGAEMCATVVGTIGGIPTIVNGSNMAIMGIQDIWNVIHGKDEESVNLIKEAMGHKFDNTVDLMELAITMGSAKKVSKVGQKAMSEAKSSLGEAFGKARKYTSAIGNEARAIAKSARKLCRNQIAKLRGPKRALKGIPVNAETLAEEFTKENRLFNKALKPNIQIFAEKSGEEINNTLRNNSAHNAALFEKLKNHLKTEEFQSLVKTTEHGVQRLITRGFTAEEIEDVVKYPTKIFSQSDGARVFVRALDNGKFNLIVKGQNGIITALKNIGEKSLERLSKNYGWS